MVKLIAAIVVLLGVLASALAAGFDMDREDDTRFRVDGARIVAPGGTTFVPTGMNLLGPNAFFNPDGVTTGNAEVLADAWGINTVRINMCLPEGCPYTGVQNDRNDDLDAIVEEYTGEGLVVMLALHQTEPGTWPDDATLDAMAEHWRDLALRYGDDPFVWFNLVNEPGSDKPASPRWAEVSTRLLRTVRDAGAENIVVLDGTSWGQEAGVDSTEPVDTANSAILTYGPAIAAADDSVVFSFHVYDQWAGAGLDDAGREERMTDFVDRVHEAGLPLLMGEVGSPAGADGDGRSRATRSAYRVAAARDVGILAWHGQGIDGFQLVSVDDEQSSPSAIDDWSDPTNLSWHGRLLWDIARRPGR